LTADCLKTLKRKIQQWSLVPSDGGKFEISVNGKLIYSKLQTGEFPESEQVIKLLKKS